MTPTIRLALLLLFALGVALAVVPQRLEGRSAAAAGVPTLSADERAATFTFDPGTPAADRQAFVEAVAASTPQARRLVALVDGVTTVRIARTPPDALGITSDTDDGWLVEVDMARVLRISGGRGLNRVVLHELGHVIDRAVVPDAVMAPMIDAIPTGFGCEDGLTGACAPGEERFAETFAKWATGDIGVDLPMGYKVPPPSVPLEAWARPLAALGR
jgi:hypothetical protein